MSHVKQRNIEGSTFYHESKRGSLKKGEITKRTTVQGLLKKEIAKVNLDKEGNLNIKDSQVLRSDSGGPLLLNGKIIGLIRNYEICLLYTSDAADE